MFNIYLQYITDLNQTYKFRLSSNISFLCVSRIIVQLVYSSKSRLKFIVLSKPITGASYSDEFFFISDKQFVRDLYLVKRQRYISLYELAFQLNSATL